jgi:hypothetical protein
MTGQGINFSLVILNNLFQSLKIWIGIFKKMGL